MRAMRKDAELKDKKKLANGGVSLYMAEWPDKGRIQRRWKYQRIGRDDDSKSVPKQKDESEKKPRKDSKTISVKKDSTKKKEEPKKKKKKEEPKRKEKEKPSETILVEPEVSVSSPLSSRISMSEEKTEKKQSPTPKWKQQKQARIEEEERREFEEEQKRSKVKSEMGLEAKVDQLMEMLKQLMAKMDELQKGRQSTGLCLSLHSDLTTKLDEDKKKLLRKMVDEIKQTLDEKKTD